MHDARSAQIEALRASPLDVLIVGAGITRCVPGVALRQNKCAIDVHHPYCSNVVCVTISPMRRATCRAEALSQACPTASSRRLLKGDLLGNGGTFSTLIPHSGQFTRYSSIATVVVYSDHGKSR